MFLKQINLCVLDIDKVLFLESRLRNNNNYFATLGSELEMHSLLL